MKALMIAVALAALGGAAWLALQPQMRFAEIANEMTAAGQLGPLVVPVDAGTHAELMIRAKAGQPAQGLVPRFTYLDAAVGDRTLKARPAYLERDAPEGPFVTMTIGAFLESVERDPDAQAAVINPGVSSYSRAVDKATVSRLRQSLRQRGVR